MGSVSFGVRSLFFVYGKLKPVGESPNDLVREIGGDPTYFIIQFSSLNNTSSDVVCKMGRD